MLDTPSRRGAAAELSKLSDALTDLVALMNQSPLAGQLVREAKVPLDPALLRILACVYRFGPIGVVELAERACRDHTTVSRQVAKLQEQGLVERSESPADRRISLTRLTAKGRQTADALLAAREKVVGPIMARWSEKDLSDLTRLMRQLVDDLAALKAARTEL